MNDRHVRGLEAIVKNGGRLHYPELHAAIGPYATNTVRSLVDRGLIRRGPIELGFDEYELTDAGAECILEQRRRGATS